MNKEFLEIKNIYILIFLPIKALNARLPVLLLFTKPATALKISGAPFP